MQNSESESVCINMLTLHSNATRGEKYYIRQLDPINGCPLMSIHVSGLFSEKNQAHYSFNQTYFSHKTIQLT